MDSLAFANLNKLKVSTIQVGTKENPSQFVPAAYINAEGSNNRTIFALNPASLIND